MAIDTAAKRFRMLDFDIPTAPGIPPPDGTIDGDDRVAFLWLYLTPANIHPGAVSRQVLPTGDRARALPAVSRERVLSVIQL